MRMSKKSSRVAASAEGSQERQLREVFHRVKENPILSRGDLPFRATAVLNPGATQYEGQTVLLLRVEDMSGYSSIHVARSRNGVDGWKIQKQPLLRYGEAQWRYEQWGCEDARVTYVPNDDWWYITYVAYSPMGPAVGLARTSDFEQAERIALMGATNDKDAVLFPEKFEGRWAILHRPDAGGRQHIWAAYSMDLVRWGEPHCVLFEGAGAAWDAVKVGAGPPPVLTDKGWLLIYHGVKAYGGMLLYRVGLALLDRHVPHKVIARYNGCVFQPEAPYELSGIVPNVVFPTGTVVRGDELWMYYGAADSHVCLATARIKDLLDLLS